jgi:dihydropyrimidinase
MIGIGVAVSSIMKDFFQSILAFKNVFKLMTLYHAARCKRRNWCLVVVHAENGDVIDYLTKQRLLKVTQVNLSCLTRPPELEGEATGRAAKLTEMANGQLYVVHVTCADAVEKIIEARNKGVDIWGETCPQYLVLDQSYLEKPHFEGSKYVWSPPLREKKNQEVLWNALKMGQLQTISDQCSLTLRTEGTWV